MLKNLNSVLKNRPPSTKKGKDEKSEKDAGGESPLRGWQERTTS